MKKLLLCTAALTMFAGSTLALNGSSNAEANTNASISGINTGSADNGEDNTNGTTQLPSNQTRTSLNISNNNSISIYDPANLSNPLSKDLFKSHNIQPTNATGDLTLDAVPESFSWDDNNKESSNNIHQQLKSKDDDNNSSTFAQVTDRRFDNKAAWTLTANMSDMKSNTTNNPILPAAKITLVNNNKVSGYASPAGTNANLSNDEITNKAPNASQNGSNLVLMPNNNINVMSAQTGKGQQSWIDNFTNAILDAGPSPKGSYTGSITWTLTSNLSSNGVGQSYQSVSAANPSSSNKLNSN